MDKQKNGRKSIGSCERCQKLQQELDDLQEAYVGAVMDTETRHWRVTSIVADQLEVLADRYEQLQAENSHLSATVDEFLSLYKRGKLTNRSRPSHRPGSHNG
jgi:tRNA isopentenyl-2-thiomethyl-A-37 hydroxylase MiaE